MDVREISRVMEILYIHRVLGCLNIHIHAKTHENINLEFVFLHINYAYDVTYSSI